MTTYTPHPDGLFDAGKPVLGTVGLQTRDNLLSALEGDPSAPKVEDAALDTTVTPEGEVWVSDRLPVGTVGQKMSDLSFQGIGAVALMYSSSTANLAPGSNRSGSSLRFANCSGEDDNDSAPGTWRCQGELTGTSSDAERTTVFIRIA